MKEEMDRAQAELNALKRTEEDLKKGHQKLEEMVTRLDQEVVSWVETLILYQHERNIIYCITFKVYIFFPNWGACV